VTHNLVLDRIETGRAAGVLGAGVQIDIQFGSVPLQSRQTHRVADQVERPGIGDRRIGQANRAIAAYTAAIHGVQTEIQTIVVLLVQRPTGIGTEATSVLGGVKGKNRAGASGAGTRSRRDDVNARENAITEAAVDSKHFVVTKSRLKRDLGDDVG